eukprot:4007026-Karenia_brevis.AAC.1
MEPVAMPSPRIKGTQPRLALTLQADPWCTCPECPRASVTLQPPLGQFCLQLPPLSRGPF